MVKKESFLEFLSISFLFCLWVLAFWQIFSTPIFGFDIQNYELWAKIVNNILAIQYGIVIFAIISGSLLFYWNREKIENIEEEQEKEWEEEEKRKAEFPSKFPRLSKIPVFGWIVKWMYGEGWRYSLGLIGIVMLFLLTRFWVPFIYTWSYIDEYNHLFSWLDFIKNWEFSIFDTDWEYFRWAFLSIYIGLLFLLFWKTLLIAKLWISFLSFISFFLIFLLSRKLYKNKNYSNLLLFIVSINPLILFENIYIRPYIIYELIILLFMYLFFKIIDAIKTWKYIISIIYVLIINTIWIFIYFYSEQDVHRYIILWISLLISLYFYICESSKIKTKYQLINKIFHTSKFMKINIIILIIPIFYFIFNINDLIIAIFQERTFYWSSSIGKYYLLFFRDYLVFTVLWIFVIYKIIFAKKFKKIYLIFIIYSLLICAHILSHEKSHLLRWIIYILPAYFIICIYWIDRLDKIIPKKMKILYLFIWLLFLINSYPKDFINHPYIPNEINYVEYKKIGDFLNKTCSKKEVIILMHSPHIFNFYDVNINYTSNIRLELLTTIKNYYLDNNWNYKTIYNNIPVLTNMTEIINKINTNSCFVITEDYKHSWYYIDEKDITLLENFYNKKQFWVQTPVNVFYKN